MTERHIVTGRVIAVQEERLRLMTDTGQNLLLTLSTFARLPASLDDMQHTQVPLRVIYEGEPNLATGIVRKIELV